MSSFSWAHSASAAQRTASNGHSHCTVKVADESGAINLTLWDEAGEYLQPGDVCALRHGSTSVYKGVMSLNAGKNAEITKVNRIVLGASLTPDMSAYSGELDKFFSSKAGPDDSEDTKGEFGRGSCVFVLQVTNECRPA